MLYIGAAIAITMHYYFSFSKSFFLIFLERVMHLFLDFFLLNNHLVLPLVTLQPLNNISLNTKLVNNIVSYYTQIFIYNMILFTGFFKEILFHVLRYLMVMPNDFAGKKLVHHNV